VLKRVFTSAIPTEAELVRARLEGAGFHPVVGGARVASALFSTISEVAVEVAVPEEELDGARTYLLESTLLLDETLPSGEIPDGAVCPVHEGPAVAVCDRCGTFLCARCGSLGAPPLCEDCVVRSDAPRPRPAWAMTIARVWAFGWLMWIVLGLLAGLAVLIGMFRARW
jgi:hypothetical protein